jgi:pimeloyl-ACP methyl ester carboxylesterase
MGGMIAQWLAIRHPKKVLSLVSIMSTTGDRSVGLPTPEVMETMLRPPAATMDESIEVALDSYRRFASPGYTLDEDRCRAREERQHHRAWYPEGAARQLVAIIASGDWTEKLKGATAPTLVIHGADDPVVTPDGGEATARAIPGAELMIIPGMSHELPEPLWPTVFDAIVRNSKRATATTAAPSRTP